MYRPRANSSAPAVFSTASGILYNTNNGQLSDTTFDFTPYLPFQVISSACFSYSLNLSTITSPSSVRRIESNAFLNCGNLRTLLLESNSKLQEIQDGAFAQCGIQSLQLDRSIVSTIGNAFPSNSSLGYVSLPSTLTLLQGSFPDCQNLSTVRFASNVRASPFLYIGGNTFSNDISLQTIRFPPGWGRVASDTFLNCTSLSYVIFDPSYIVTKNSYEFIDSNALNATNLQSITLPGDVPILAKADAFGKSPLRSINVLPSFTQFRSLTQENTGIPPSIDFTIYTLGANSNNRTGCEYNVTNFLTNPPQNSSTFQSVVKSSELVLTLSTLNTRYLVTNTYTSNMFLLNSNITVQTIGCLNGSRLPIGNFPIGLSTIAYLPLDVQDSIALVGASNTYSFARSQISTLTISGNRSYGLTSTFQIENRTYQFLGNGPGSLWIRSLNPIWQVVNGVFSFVGNSVQTGTTFDLLGASRQSNFHTIAPGCFGVSSIFGDSSQKATWPNLSYLTIPSSVTVLGQGAFAGCGKFSTITFQQPSRLTNIQAGAFANTNIATIPLQTTPRLSTIGAFAFAFAPLGGMYVPSSVTTLGANLRLQTGPTTYQTVAGLTFAFCANFSTIQFASNSRLQTILPTTFSATNLQSIQIPDSVRYISTNAFTYCSSLTNIHFTTASRLQRIDDFACSGYISPNSILATNSGLHVSNRGCPLQSITLPNSLSTLGLRVFSSCIHLVSINVLSTFKNYSVFTKESVGIPPSQLPVFYTLGTPVVTPPNSLPYRFLNAFAVQNKIIFQKIVRSMPAPILRNNMNANFLISYNPDRTNVSSIRMNFIPCINGSVVPSSFVSTDPTVYNYFTMNQGETITVAFQPPITLKKNAIPNVTVNGSSRHVPYTFQNNGLDMKIWAES